MKAAITAQEERTEVEQLLQSGIFQKSPRLERFFRYICDKHFEGRVDCLKEYSIALEALGRQPDFDPKRDSIVRVEAHRLRRRLENFYRGPGLEHALRIVIPNGQYRPQFVSQSVLDGPMPHAQVAEQIPERDSDQKTNPELAVIDPRDISPVLYSLPRNPPRSRWFLYLAAALVFTALFALAMLRLDQKPAGAQPAHLTPEVWRGNPVDTAGAEIRILAGYHGAPYLDRQSHIWQPDAYYEGGNSRPVPVDRYIEAQPDPHLLRSMRTGNFQYAIPLRQGTYELHLLFAETEFGTGNREGTGEGSRTFSIDVNGQTRLPSCDPLAEAGAPNRLDERVLQDVSPATDGKLHLKFSGATAVPMLSGIEVLPSAPGLLHPIRIVSQANPVTDADGRVWAADEYVVGGTSVFRENASFDPKKRALYQGERFGNFSYRIPVAPGKYRLILHFAEQWFGTPLSGMADVNHRVFDVYANGVALLRDFKVSQAAGGPNRCVVKSFDNLQPNAQGTLVLQFLPVENYAELNGLEVVQMQ